MAFNLVYIICSVFFSLNTAYSEEASFRLEDAQNYAVRNNFHLQSLRRELRSLDHTRQKYGSLFYPRFDYYLGHQTYQRGQEDSSLPISYISGAVNLFAGGHDKAILKLAESEVHHQELELEKAEFDIRLEVEKYFFEYLYVQKLIELRAKSLEKNKYHIKLVNRKRQAGLVSEADFMEFQVREAKLQSDHIARQLVLEESRLKLKKILGQEIGAQMNPVGELPNLKITGDLNVYVEKLKTMNTHILVASHKVAVLGHQRTITKSKWYPHLDLEAQYGYLEQDGVQEEKVGSLQSRFMLVAKMNLFSGYRDYHELKSVEERTASSKNHLRDTIILAVSNAELFYRKLKALETQRQLESGNIENTQKYYEAVVEEYSRGSKNSADLAAASDLYFDAQEQRLQISFDFIKTKLDFEELLGEKIEVVDIKK